MKLCFEFDVRDAIPSNIHNISTLVFFNIFIIFLEKEPSAKFDGIFDLSSRIYKAKKFYMIRWCLHVSNVISEK